MIAPETLIGITSPKTPQPIEVPGTGRPEWTVAEVGQACAGLEPYIFQAMLYTYATADELYHPLKRALLVAGRQFREEMGWPYKATRIHGEPCDYLDELCSVCLIEERMPWRFVKGENEAVPRMYTALLGVTDRVWKRVLQKPYATLRWRYTTWLSIGRSHMKRKMRV